jgi:hypothetical protein
MELREFFSEDAIKLELEGETKDDILKELIALLKLDDKSEGMLYKMLKRRENLGSTGSAAASPSPLPVARREQAARGVRPQAARCRLQGDRREAGELLLPHRRAAARGVEPVPAGARQDRAVLQGARRAPAAPRLTEPVQFLDC